MRTSRHIYPLAMLLMLAASMAWAEGTLSIRLVEATQSDNRVSRGLRDVLPVLREGLPYAGYHLLASASMRLPSTKTSRELNGYVIACSGMQSALSIEVRRNKEELVRTVVRLQKNNPLILGGFPSGHGGKHVLVFVVR